MLSSLIRLSDAVLACGGYAVMVRVSLTPFVTLDAKTYRYKRASAT